MGGADRRAVVAGHQPQFVKQSGDAAGAGRVCCPVPVVGIVGRLCKSWRLVYRLVVVPSLVCYLVTLDAGGEGGMPMGKRKEGRERPEKRAEPREIDPSDAAPEPEPSETEPIRAHDSKSAGAPIAEAPDSLGAYLPAGPVVYDSGWRDVAQSDVSVRVVFAEGPPNAYLRAWARELMLRPELHDVDAQDA